MLTFEATIDIYGFLETNRRISFYKEKRPQPAAHEVYKIYARYEQDLFTNVSCSACYYFNKAYNNSFVQALVFHKF